ncbi:hypothetical protein EON73_02110 [bacterium]|nr:MAG: hypothetical protein EON73_02110 [bacterium]
MATAATLPSPTSKDNLSSYLSQPSVISGGEFFVEFNYNQDYPVVYTNFSPNVYNTNSNPVLCFDVSSNFDDIIYKASIRGYELPNKSIKAIFNGIYSFFNSKTIILKDSFPLYDGGIGLEFRKKDTTYLVELFNDGENVFSIEELGQPIKAWDLNHINLLKKVNSLIG